MRNLVLLPLPLFLSMGCIHGDVTNRLSFSVENELEDTGLDAGRSGRSLFNSPSQMWWWLLLERGNSGVGGKWAHFPGV